MYVAGMYNSKEFVRVAFYLKHDYTDPLLNEAHGPESEIYYDRLVRTADRTPIVTKTLIDWDYVNLDLVQPPGTEGEPVEGDILPEEDEAMEDVEGSSDEEESSASESLEEGDTPEVGSDDVRMGSPEPRKHEDAGAEPMDADIAGA